MVVGELFNSVGEQFPKILSVNCLDSQLIVLSTVLTREVGNFIYFYNYGDGIRIGIVKFIQPEKIPR